MTLEELMERLAKTTPLTRDRQPRSVRLGSRTKPKKRKDRHG